MSFTPAGGFAQYNITTGASQTQSLTFNIVTTQLVSGITVAIAPSVNFTVGSETCTASAASPVSTCTVPVTFTRTTPTVGPEAATLTVTVPYDATVTPINSFTGAPTTYQFPLSGVAVLPAVTVSPGSLSFAPTAAGTSSARQIVTLTNATASPVAITSTSNTGEFGHYMPSCGTSILASGTCTIKSMSVSARVLLPVRRPGY